MTSVVTSVTRVTNVAVDGIRCSTLIFMFGILIVKFIIMLVLVNTKIINIFSYPEDHLLCMI